MPTPDPFAVAVHVIGIDGPEKKPPFGAVTFTSGWSRDAVPSRHTRSELVVRPTIPVRRVDDASPRVRTADRVRRNAPHLANRQRVAQKRRLEHGPDPRLGFRAREWR